MHVEIRYEQKRWCGYRKPSKNGYGIYLVGPANFEPCERLPYPLETCPCCGAGVQPARGFSWINPSTLFDPWTGQPACCEMAGYEVHGLKHTHSACAMCNPIVVAGEKAGIIWIGESFYPTARDFMDEAKVMGISRKLGTLPAGFEVGNHYVYLAHRKTRYIGRIEGKETWQQGVFSAFKPLRVEIVIDDPDDVPAKAVELARRLGDKASIIKVIRKDNEGDLDDGEGY